MTSNGPQDQELHEKGLDLWSQELGAEELPEVASASTAACFFSVACFGGCFSTVSSLSCA